MMNGRSWRALSAIVFATVALALMTSTAFAKDDKPAKEAKSVFGLAKVHEFQLTISDKEYAKMQPAMREMFMGGPGGPGGPPNAERQVEKPDGAAAADVHKGGSFGQEFPWAHAALSADGKTYKDVGVRYKGNFTYGASASGLKRSLKMDFDRYDDGQRFHGLKKVNLNSGITDPARVREALSFAVFRAAGVPSPRTAYAQLSLTVAGKYDKEYVGLYTLIEQVDNAFLKEHFGSAKGLLLKPEGVRGLQDLGDDWGPYAKRYLPKDPATEKQQKQFIEFVHLVNKADAEKFNKEIGSYLDVDAFLRFLATNALVVNLDSFLAFGHNYYLYLRPDTNQFVFIPWDLDLAFGTWPMGGSPEQQTDLSLAHPHAGENKLIDRLLANKEVNAKYQMVLKELAGKCFTTELLQKEMDDIEAATRDSLAREKKAVEARREGGGMRFGPPGAGGGGIGAMFGQAMSLKAFVTKRTESVAAQLAGKSKGYVPQMGFGPFVPPQPGQVMPVFLQDRLQLTADQKTQLEELQKEVDGKLGKILTEEQKKRMKEIR